MQSATVFDNGLERFPDAGSAANIGILLFRKAALPLAEVSILINILLELNLCSFPYVYVGILLFRKAALPLARICIISCITFLNVVYSLLVSFVFPCKFVGKSHSDVCHASTPSMV